jgi:hypothetical protein
MHDVQCAVGFALLDDTRDIDLAGACTELVSDRRVKAFLIEGANGISMG